MQKFNYHCHTSHENVFDGQNTPDEMISAYKEKGFTEVGISNHCIYNRIFEKIPKEAPSYFHNIDDLVDIHKRCFDLIDESAAKHNIKVYKGMEVDFFQSKEWRNDFETILKKLNPDYVIGATHFLKSKNNDFICNLYVLDQYPPIPEESMKELLQSYWKNVVECINSGYFKFVVHPDYCTQYGLSVTPEWDECKYKVIEALHRTKTACEINTKSIRRRGYPSPDWWIVKELIKKEVPLLISDDAHGIEDVGTKFAEVEEKLAEFGCKNRFVSL